MLRHLRSRKDPAVQPELAIEVAGSEPASASSVVEAAARLLGKAPPSPAALEKEDVLWDWQLATLSEQQYERLGFSAGWQAAIARVLKGGSSQARRPVSELPLKLRRFLLLPEPDGSEPPRLTWGLDALLFSFLIGPCEGTAAAQRFRI